MFLIFKKGDPVLPDNYRGISLLNSMTKIFTALLSNRVLRWSELSGILPETQSAFRRGRGTTDNLFILSSLITNCIRTKRGKLFYSILLFYRFRKSVWPYKPFAVMGKTSQFQNVLKNNKYSSFFLRLSQCYNLNSKLFNATNWIRKWCSTGGLS